MAKFCKNCGAPLDEGIKFCKSCGTAVAANSSSGNGVQQVGSTEPGRQEGASYSMANTHKQMGAEHSKNKQFVIIGLLIAILVAAAGGGYYYYHQQQVKIEQMQAEQAAAEEAKAKKEAEEKAAKEQNDKQQAQITSAYIQKALSQLDAGERDLKSLADMINSGVYMTSTLLNEEANVVSRIEGRRADLKKMTAPADSSIVNDVEALYSIQTQRANFMAKGIQGDTSQYAVGGNYYDQYYAKLDAFKKVHNVQ